MLELLLLLLLLLMLLPLLRLLWGRLLEAAGFLSPYLAVLGSSSFASGCRLMVLDGGGWGLTD